MGYEVVLSKCRIGGKSRTDSMNLSIVAGFSLMHYVKLFMERETKINEDVS